MAWGNTTVPFVAGSGIGARYFVVDDGWLYGFMELHNRDRMPYSPDISHARHIDFYEQWRSSIGADERFRVHRVASEECMCGIHAAFDINDTGISLPALRRIVHPNDHDRVVVAIRGMIEGFGTVTVGSLGFRSSRARVKALVHSPQEFRADDYRETVRHLKARYPDVPWYDTWGLAREAVPLTTPKELGFSSGSVLHDRGFA